MFICIGAVLRLFNTIQYNTIQYKTYNAPYVTKMLFVGAGLFVVVINICNLITITATVINTCNLIT